ncbi:MAG: acetoin utilization protein AcuC, partial [Nitrososphaerales archaeon]
MCNIGVFIGEAFKKYSFPDRPLGGERIEAFWKILKKERMVEEKDIKIIAPVMATDNLLLLFHKKEFLDFVKDASKLGFIYLNPILCFGGDTPAFKGIFEAACYVVGSTLLGLDMIMKKEFNHIFNPIGGM